MGSSRDRTREFADIVRSKLLFVLQAGSMVGSSRDRTREFADTVRSKLLFVLQAGSIVGSSRDRTREFADTVRSKLLFVLQTGSMVGSSRDRTREFADTVRSLQGRTANGHAVFRPVSTRTVPYYPIPEMQFLKNGSNRKFLFYFKRRYRYVLWRCPKAHVCVTGGRTVGNSPFGDIMYIP